MDTITMRCPCGKSYEVPDTLIGKTVTCLECKTPLTVKMPTQPAEQTPMKVQPNNDQRETRSFAQGRRRGRSRRSGVTLTSCIKEMAQAGGVILLIALLFIGGYALLNRISDVQDHRQTQVDASTENQSRTYPQDEEARKGQALIDAMMLLADLESLECSSAEIVTDILAQNQSSLWCQKVTIVREIGTNLYLANARLSHGGTISIEIRFIPQGNLISVRFLSKI